MLFWILRVYELDFDLVRNKDFFYTGAMGNYRIDNPDTLMRIQSSFDNARVRPVLDEEEFLEKMSKILSITIKWDKLDDDDDS